MSNTAILRSPNLANLPDDCVNLIFEYLSHLLDAKWRLVIDPKDGRIRMRYNRYYRAIMPVSNLFEYKYHLISRCGMGGRHKKIHIYFAPSSEVIQVEALQNYRSVVSQDEYNSNAQNGFIDCGVCYTYNHPVSGEIEVIYVDWRAHVDDEDGVYTLLRGTLHKRGNILHNVEDYYLAENGDSVINVQEMSMDWIIDTEGDPTNDWTEDDFELIDYEQLEAEAMLQMYD